MKFNTIFFLIFILNSSNFCYAQNCEEIRAEASKLDRALSEDNSDSHYDYSVFLLKLANLKNTCIF